ncbi:putative ribosome biogenesis protein noc4 [Phaeomoniella chlamydospora]|uniref:Putative ribosome biogenesis protein noc4 n=1 Tax=Phaeomoniella chlamydospora TaxID=158046 RepID=A0A0G2EWG4_PHACM|nr:putative ribosome biogenesis protein noc4 [Phaeomoniella chlamydospora]
MSADAVMKKRRRREEGVQKPSKKSKNIAVVPEHSGGSQQRISELEAAIAEGTNTLENVATLLSFVPTDGSKSSKAPVALISLCKCFTRLMASGHIKPSFDSNTGSSKISRLLREYYATYQDILLQLLHKGTSKTQITALQLSFQMLKAQSEHLEENVWHSKAFFDLMTTLFEAQDGAGVRALYSQEYFSIYNDCTYHTLEFLSTYSSKAIPSDLADNIIGVLATLSEPPKPVDELTNFFIESSAKSTKKGKPLITPSSLRRAASSAWLALLASASLTTAHRKRLLGLLTSTILPWLTRPETLFDFLTASFDQGGSLSLLTLSGMYNLITTKNLDYPSFYPKLYSLLNPSLMHSKHRSRFFRHLQIFLSSTHLPATLVASFIKRLSRLSLHAPPAAIVAIVPYIYNLLKSHPQTTFMIHRPITPDPSNSDPFNPDDPNPLTTNAISSSLWELYTLAFPTTSLSTTKTTLHPLSHYNPNVTSLAQILCLQFTKQAYNLEDFLDHSYNSMLDAELKRGEVKKEPVVEWRISKRILCRDDEAKREGEAEAEAEEEKDLDLVRKLWQF